MPLLQAVNNVFVQLSGSPENLSQEDDVKPSKNMGEVSTNVKHNRSCAQ